MVQNVETLKKTQGGYSCTCCALPPCFVAILLAVFIPNSNVSALFLPRLISKTLKIVVAEIQKC